MRRFPSLFFALFSIVAVIMPFLTACAQFEENVISNQKNQQEYLEIREKQPNRTKYRGIIPAPGDGVEGGFESAEPYASGKTKIRRDIGQKIADGELALNDIPYILHFLINFFTMLAGGICVSMLVYGGIKLVLSGLTEDKEGAKNTLWYALIGLVVTFSAWQIVGTIQIHFTSGLGSSDGYTLEESYRESLHGFSELRTEEDNRLPMEYPSHLPGAGEERLKGDASDFTLWLQNFAGELTALVTTVAIFFIAIIAFKMVTSAGNADTIAKVKKAFQWVFIGIMLIIFSYILVKTVISLPYSGQMLKEPEMLSALLRI